MLYTTRLLHLSSILHLINVLIYIYIYSFNGIQGKKFGIESISIPAFVVNLYMISIYIICHVS